jgi:hypothetical protein
MLRPRPKALLLVISLLAPVGSLVSGTVQVQVTLPLPERIDMTGISTILITRLVLENDNPKVDLNREMIGLLKRELRKKTSLRVLDVEPPSLPEQSLEELVENSLFWKDLAEKYGADLILTGSLGYEISDRSGFVQEDFISPVTGQRLRRTRFVDREGFDMDLHLYFLRGLTGKLVFDDKFSEDTTMDGKGNDPLTALFNMFEHIESDVLGIVSRKEKVETRTLFTR